MPQQQDRAEARRAKVEALRAKDKQRSARRKNVTMSVAAIGVFAVVAAVWLAISSLGSEQAGVNPAAAGAPQVVREDSHRLQTAADGKVTLVEFLDFECEACRAYFPVVEQLRKEYTGRVTFVARYFPIGSHFNAERAARAVEAAARQGKFEAMYQQMYETQTQWGEKQQPADAFFRKMAEGLGLDLAAWDKAYEDPATLARVKKDAADGEALGVQGTPTFFLNGRRIEPQSADEFKAAIDAALAQ
ncbi:DsbA family protein [Nonomuraea jiangxiensis]|uniref:Protein-disulfide isomerase n=1 Tax=Nonomuraea jiangxiensis TaxID=633440 RepID=A0A1G9ISF4_9ACTN|nr:thioredoxin domain-containing protein [Nonomuraea jiangxiensis]SDL28107.1 Protein-disulfide isomerase [Nonomuraea jiangxiensis]